MEILEAAHKAAKKGNASMIKFLVGRHDLGAGGRAGGRSENPPAAPTEHRPTKDIPLGKEGAEAAGSGGGDREVRTAAGAPTRH